MLNKGYSDSSASFTKRALKGMIPNSGNAQEDIDENNQTLRERARMLYMAAPLAASAIRTNRTNVVGTGLELKSSIDYEVLGYTPEQAIQWQRKTEAEFSLWANDKHACDATGVNDFYSIQQLILVSWLLSGDVFTLIKQQQRTARHPYGLRLHVLEADRCRTPSSENADLRYSIYGKTSSGNAIYDGVEIDKQGAIVAYHIANTHPTQFSLDSTKFARIAAYGEKTGLPNILHIMDSERPEQYRGVTYLAQVIEPLLQMRRYTEAELTAALVQSFFTAFVTTQTDPSMIPFNEANGEPPTPEVSHSGNEYEMGPGTINHLAPGESVTFGSPTHPQMGFETFMRAVAEHVGAALEVPADILLKSFNSSYSASRGALLEAWKAFKMRRKWLTQDFCRPVYEIWMTEAVALGRISAPGFLTDPLIRQAYLGSTWIGPAQGQLDPIKEVNAAAKAIQEGLSTRTQETIRLDNGDFTANISQLEQENRKYQAAMSGVFLPAKNTYFAQEDINDAKE